jgi:multiple sugar transport system permease protein
MRTATYQEKLRPDPKPVKRKRNFIPLWFLLPALVVIAVVFLAPILFAFVISFFRFDLNLADYGFRFVGFRNFLFIFQDKLFLQSIRWTFLLAFIVVVVELALGLAFAMLLNSPALGRARDFLRSIFLVPIILSAVLTAWMWRLMFDASYGPVNHLVTLLGFDKIAWGADALSARAMIVIADVWLSTPFIMIILLAGLQNIPKEILEAASIDGATRWRKFSSIILPYLKFPLMVAAVIRTMDALRTFDQIFVLTSGGPGSATTTIMFYNYRYAFSYFQMGRASAMSFAFLIVIFLISFLYTRLLQRETDYS